MEWRFGYQRLVEDEQPVTPAKVRFGEIAPSAAGARDRTGRLARGETVVPASRFAAESQRCIASHPGPWQLTSENLELASSQRGRRDPRTYLRRRANPCCSGSQAGHACQTSRILCASSGSCRTRHSSTMIARKWLACSASLARQPCSRHRAICRSSHERRGAAPANAL